MNYKFITLIVESIQASLYAGTVIGRSSSRSRHILSNAIKFTESGHGAYRSGGYEKENEIVTMSEHTVSALT